MSLERNIINKTIRYLISRDVFILILFIGQVMFSFIKLEDYMNFVIALFIIVALISLTYYLRLIFIVLRHKKNTYLQQAFKDECFSNIKIKSGAKAFISMTIMSIILLFTGIALEYWYFQITIPVYFISELILFVGIITNDIYMILYSRG